MSTPYAQFYGCSIGGASFQLTGYAYKEEPIVDGDKGRTGTRIAVTAEGWIEAATAALLSAAQIDTIGSLSVSGQSITITGLGGGVELSVHAGTCLNGGPHIQFEIDDGDEPLKRNVKFTLTAEVGVGNGGSAAEVAWKESVETRPDGLRVATRSGDVLGPGASDYFAGVILPTLQDKYPLAQWVPNYRADRNQAGDKVSYDAKFVELLRPLPSAGQGDYAVEGTGTTRTERDEQMRKMTTVAFDGTVVGDPMRLYTQMRPKKAPLRESLEFTDYAQQRVRIEFVTLEGGDGSDLLDWQQDLDVDQTVDVTREAIEYPGLPPLIVRSSRPAYRVVQRGYAVGAGRYVAAPDPLWKDKLEKPGLVTYEDVSNYEKRTNWTYYFLSDAPFDVSQQQRDKLARPDQPTFL